MSSKANAFSIEALMGNAENAQNLESSSSDALKNQEQGK